MAFALLVWVPAEQRQRPSPINRNVERFEKSVRTVLKERDTQDLTEIGHEARKAAYQLVLVTLDAMAAADELSAEPGMDEESDTVGTISEKLNQVPKLVGPIRKISFLDPTQNSDRVAFDQPEEWRQVRTSLVQLYRLALSIRTRVDSFYGLEGIKVSELEAFSLRAMTQAAKDLSQSISKVARDR